MIRPAPRPLSRRFFIGYVSFACAVSTIVHLVWR